MNLKDDTGHAPGINHLQTDKDDRKRLEELMGGFLEELISGGTEGCVGPVIGVIDLDPENGVGIGIKEPVSKREKRRNDNCPTMPVCDGCGEEVFQEMLGDLNYMAEMIMEADFLMKMVCDENVDPEDARGITLLSIREAVNIMKKWDEYRSCGI